MHIWVELVAIGPKLLSVLEMVGIVLIGSILFHAILLQVRKVLLKYFIDERHIIKMATGAIWLIMNIAGIIAILATAGINVFGIVASLGLGSFALGYALKDTLSNIIAGLMLLAFHPFGIHDKVLLSGHTGIVGEINLRYIKIVTDDNTEVMIPSSVVLTSSIEVLQRHSDITNRILARR